MISASSARYTSGRDIGRPYAPWHANRHVTTTTGSSRVSTATAAGSILPSRTRRLGIDSMTLDIRLPYPSAHGACRSMARVFFTLSGYPHGSRAILDLLLCLVL